MPDRLGLPGDVRPSWIVISNVLEAKTGMD